MGRASTLLLIHRATTPEGAQLLRAAAEAFLAGQNADGVRLLAEVLR